jgi:hypothetical protein
LGGVEFRGVPLFRREVVFPLHVFRVQGQECEWKEWWIAESC